MKKVVVLVLTICMGILYVGCSKSVSKREKGPVLISTTTSFGPCTTNAGAYDTLLKEFRSINQHVIVKDKSVTADDDWKGMIRSRFEAGEEPDVMFFFTKSDVKDIIDKNQVVSIDEIREKYPDYASNIKTEALEAVAETDGKAYCVPAMGFWEGLYCNKELFSKYNVPMITDWDSLVYAINTFNANGVTPVAASLVEVPNYWIDHSILSVGELDKHSANPKSSDEVPKEWVNGLNLLTELYNMKAFQSDTLATSHQLSVQVFNKGQTAMILDGSWMFLEPSMQDKVQVVPFPSYKNEPRAEKGVIAGFSMGFYISRKAWEDPLKRDVCVQYVQYMTQNDSIARLSTAAAPAADIEIPFGSSPVTKEGYYLCNNNTIEMPIDSRLTKSAWEYLLKKIPNIVKGEIKPEEALNMMVKYNK